MPRMKKPYIANLDEVKISRRGDTAIIEYLEPNVYTTHLKLGKAVVGLTDREILEAHNNVLRTEAQLAAEYEHIAVEVPPGSPQIRYFAPGDQWTPRGHVLRCVIDDGGIESEATVWIDDEELSLREFGRLLSTYAGWGMRICFVPDDETEQIPTVEVREPEDR